MEKEKLSVLVVPNALFFPPYLDELREQGLSGGIPRSWVHDIDAEVEFLDQRLRTNPPKVLRTVYRALPMWVVQVLEVYRTGRNYDVVFLWSVANVSLVLALLLKLTFRRMTLVALFTRVSEPKKANLLKLVHGSFARIILPPATQREFAIKRLGVPALKLVDLPWTADTEFWCPSDEDESEKSMICAAGGEMRDYGLLVEALNGLDIHCHIAGALDTERQDWWNTSGSEVSGNRDNTTNISFGMMSPFELRQLYAKSRFVVVPLKPTTSDNGITCMNEAWAMALPVIVSSVDGQRGAFTDGHEGIWVPQGDVQALRTAILSLWNDVEKVRTMGAAGRKFVEEDKANRVFSDGLNRLFAEVVATTMRRTAA